MKKKSTSKSAFFNLRVLLASLLCIVGVFVAMLGMGTFSNLFAQTKGTKQAGAAATQDAPGTQTPQVVRIVGPAVAKNLRDLPYVPQKPEIEERRLTRYPFPLSGESRSVLPRVQSLLGQMLRPVPNMPPPLLTFEGINIAQSQCGCHPPDPNGDVGPNNYVEATNVVFTVFDKSGNTLAGPTTYNTLFAPLGTGTPCGNGQNAGDPIAFYDQVADRWVISDFAFPGFPGSGPFYQCIAVSQTPDPTAAYNLYALLVDPSNLDDYPKFALWTNPEPGGAYFLTVNLFNGTSEAFVGVRAFALDRGSMLSGGPANAIGFMIPAGNPGLGDAYSLVAANFRTGTAPPADRDEMLLAVDSPSTGGVTQTAVKGWLFHVDFVTPSNSTLGTGTNHAPNALITVNAFTDAFTSTTSDLVPQQGTTGGLDTLGDKIMTPMVYQNRNGTESLWADQTILLNYPSGPTAVRWYQFDVTGGVFPATPVQQEDWSNGNDGLWRWMPSIAVDNSGNTAIGYSTSSSSIFPSIRYAGRLASDPPNNLGQGEAIMINGGGSQATGGRWGDYTMTTIDTDGMTFWHTNEYYQVSGGNWNTRVGKFNFPSVSPTPTPTPTPRATPSPRPRPTPPPRP
jgi:hypothetical protein